MRFAYVECELSIDDFFNLSWYEFHLLIDKRDSIADAKKLEQEVQWCRTGEILAMIAEVNRDSKKRSTPFTRKDFIKVSWDKDDVKNIEGATRMTPEEVSAKYKKFLKPKTNGGLQ